MTFWTIIDAPKHHCEMRPMYIYYKDTMQQLSHHYYSGARLLAYPGGIVMTSVDAKNLSEMQVEFSSRI